MTNLPSHLGGMLRLAWQGFRVRRGTSQARGPMPGRRLAVERRGMRVDPRRVARFLEVTDGARISAFRDADPLLPPTYCALWETALALELLGRSGAPLPLRGLIHQASELVQLRPIYVGDAIRCRLELERTEPTPTGTRLTLVARNWNRAGQLCQQNTMVLLVRGEPAGGGRAGTEREGRVEGAWEELVGWKLPGSHGRRYARVSGDLNPIHLWAWTARPLGFRRPILHGFCTAGMVAHALIERVMGGDPCALRRLEIGFRSPLPLPCEPRLLVARAPATGAGRFRVVGEEEARPFVEGSFVGGN